MKKFMQFISILMAVSFAMIAITATRIETKEAPKIKEGKDMAFDKNQIEDLTRRTLAHFSFDSDSAVNLVLGTIAQESKFGTYLRQLGKGPALGICQMEPATLNDIWENYLKYKPDLVQKIKEVTGCSGPDLSALEADLRYAIIMARIHYRRVKAPLPDSNDVGGLAAYWKEHYNTIKGAGSVEEFVKNYKKYVVT